MEDWTTTRTGNSLGLLPSGPDPVGEGFVRRQSSVRTISVERGCNASIYFAVPVFSLSGRQLLEAWWCRVIQSDVTKEASPAS